MIDNSPRERSRFPTFDGEPLVHLTFADGWWERSVARTHAAKAAADLAEARAATRTRQARAVRGERPGR